MKHLWRSFGLLVSVASITTVFVTSVSAGAITNKNLSSLESDVVVDTEVSKALDSSNEVNVIINLADVEISDLTSKSKKIELENVQEEIIEDADLQNNETKTFENIPVISTSIDSEQLAALKADPLVESISISNYYTPMDVRNGSAGVLRPSLNQAIPIVEADAAWNNSTPYTGSGKKIVVVDTGVQASHPFLSGAVVSELCFAEGPNGPGGAGSCPNNLDSQTGSGAAAPCITNSSCGHGTHVAGIASGRRSVSGAPIGGVAPDSQVVAIQVFSTFTNADLNYQGNPMCESVGTSSPCILTSDSDVLEALDYVLNNRTNVAAVNLSLGGGLYNSACDVLSPYQATTISQLRTYGILTIVASGNEGNTSKISWPACISSAVAVGATTDADSVASFSNSNSMLNFWAPGNLITSSLPTSPDIYDGNENGSASNYGIKSGTSMATPMISGAVAVLRQAYPNEAANQIVARLLTSGVNVTDSRNGVTKNRPSIFEALNSDTPSYTELVRTASNPTVYLLNGSSKHRITSLGIFLDYLAIGAVRYVDQTYIDGFVTMENLTSTVGSTANSDVFLISSGEKSNFDSCEVAEQFGSPCPPSVLLPPEQLSKFTSVSSVSRLVKNSYSPAVYYVDGGQKRRIASWADLIGLGIGVDISIVSDSVLNSLSTGSLLLTGGSLVKSDSSVKVYVVNDWDSSPSVFGLASFGDSVDLGLGASVKTITQSELNAYTKGSNLKTTIKCGSEYFIGHNGLLYQIDPSLFTHFGYTVGSFITSESMCNRLVQSPTDMTRYIKSGVSIYRIDNGTKRKFMSMQAFIANNGYSQTIINVSLTYANTLPDGAPIYS